MRYSLGRITCSKSLNLENLNISKLIEKQLQPLKSSSSHLNIRRLIHSKLFIWNCSSIFCVAGKRGMVSEKEKKPACFAAQQATAAILLTHG